MTDTYSILFCFQNRKEVRQIEHLNRILHTLVSHGYYLAGKEEQWHVQAQFDQWVGQIYRKVEQNQIPPIPFQPGISDLTRQQVEGFCQTKVGRCELGGFWAADSGPGCGFDFFLTFYNDDPMPGTLALSFDQDFFITIDHEEHYTQWLKTIEAIYNTGDFLYVYQIDHTGFHQPTLYEDLLAQGVTRLYPLNIFGPKLVEQLGRERLLSTPAGLITTLEDSGILLIPYLSGPTRPPRRLSGEPKAAAAYLGLIYGEQ